MKLGLALAVAGLGAVGSLLRWLVGLAAARLGAGPGFPWGTLAVNLLGSLAIGAVMAGFAAREALDAPTRVALTAGLLGGFTTYSAFAFETWSLIDREQVGRAALYGAATLIGGLLACAAGIALARRYA